MAKLDIDWLGAFVQIYKARSISLAAERLGVTQARVSGVLGKLRRHFGDPLFARTSRGMEPTPYADRIYPDIVQCVERLASAREHRADFDHTKATRQFRICMTDISEIIVLPTLINQVRRLAPRVVIECERISPLSRMRLESGDVDLAVGYMPDLEAGFYQQTLFMQGFVCLASRHHPRIRGRLSVEDFLKEGHLVVTTSGTGHSIVDRVFAQGGIDRNIVLRVPSFLSVARLVADTQLIATVPRMLGEVLAVHEGITMCMPPIPLPTYAVKLHWHARFHADRGNVWLRKVIARTLGDDRMKGAPGRQESAAT